MGAESLGRKKSCKMSYYSKLKFYSLCINNKRPKSNKDIFVILLLLFLLFMMPVDAKQKKQEEVDIKLPEYTYVFELYNSYPKNLNLAGLRKNRQLNLNGVVSPDFKRMVYTEVYSYPQTNQTSSALYMINLDTDQTKISRVLNASVKNKDRIPLLTTGLDSSEKDLFRTLTVVDWSEDGSKLLIKEKVGLYQLGLWATNVWVYDFVNYKTQMLTEVRQAIKHFWQKKDIFLDDFLWDIEVIGWDSSNKDRIIVYAYGVDKEDCEKFLGAWSIDANANTSMLLSLTKKDYTVSNNGYILIPTKKLHYY